MRRRTPLPTTDDVGASSLSRRSVVAARICFVNRSSLAIVLLSITLTAAVTLAATSRASCEESSRIPVVSGATRVQWLEDTGRFRFLRHREAVLTASAVPAWSVSAQPASKEGGDCIVLDVAAGGSLRFDIDGHWYGGPSVAQGFWPASKARIVHQRWLSNDMLADRSRLGSVLEGIWLTSSGASIRLLEPAADFSFSFNAPCGSPDEANIMMEGGGAAPAAAPTDGQMCLTRAADAFGGGDASSSSSNDLDDQQPPQHPHPPALLQLEVCTASDVRAAQLGLLHRLPRPLVPQPPSLDLVRAPVWSSWARFKMAVDQAKVEGFAEEIAAHGFPRSHFEVDDKWSPMYGDLLFDKAKFPAPHAMVDKLRRLGFGVTLWVTPFAEPGADAYAEGGKGGHWLRAADGAPAVVTWWQGAGVLLNVSHPPALDWFEGRLRSLMASTGVVGFKFDAGEAQFVPPGAMADPNAYCAAWAAFAARFGGGGEVRCAGASQSAGLWTREFDKDSRWSHHNGLRALITAALQQGVVGYPFVLPDMVGGNAYSEAMVESAAATAAANDPEEAAAAAATEAVGRRAADEDGGNEGGDDGTVAATAQPSAAALSSLFYGDLPPRELYVRWCLANALLPAVQFSIAPWQYDTAATAACKRALEVVRAERLPELTALALRAAETGEPIVRPLWWHDPHDPTCLWVDDEYMLGNRTLVAPVLEAGAKSRPVYLPAGRWREASAAARAGGRVHEGATWLVDYRVPLDDVAVFELVS